MLIKPLLFLRVSFPTPPNMHKGKFHDSGKGQPCSWGFPPRKCFQIYDENTTLFPPFCKP